MHGRIANYYIFFHCSSCHHTEKKQCSFRAAVLERNRPVLNLGGLGSQLKISDVFAAFGNRYSGSEVHRAEQTSKGAWGILE
jgi:hypothetical protein